MFRQVKCWIEDMAFNSGDYRNYADWLMIDVYILECRMAAATVSGPAETEAALARPKTMILLGFYNMTELVPHTV